MRSIRTKKKIPALTHCTTRNRKRKRNSQNAFQTPAQRIEQCKNTVRRDVRRSATRPKRHYRILTDLFESSAFSWILLRMHHRRHFQASGAAAAAIENDGQSCWMWMWKCPSIAPREEKGPRQDCSSWKPTPQPTGGRGRVFVSWFVFVSS